jgi:antitoxin component YwqK of YwqJK toxin-antitoxin module
MNTRVSGWSLGPRAALLAALLYCPTGCSTAERRSALEQSANEPAGGVQLIEEYWPDGRLRLRKEVLTEPNATHVNHGKYTRWHDNGNREYEATYIHGELHGIATAWHKNGEKWTEEHYDHGVRNGLRRNWDEQGRLRGEENYLDGKPHGTWTIWKKDGSVKWQGHFDRGKPQ